MGKASIVMNPAMATADDKFLEDSHRMLMDWCAEGLDLFLSSPYCASWKRKKKKIAEFFIQGFVDYAYRYHLAKPFQYNESLVEEICLAILPRKMSTDAKDFKEVGPILSSFFQWCEAEGLLTHARLLRSKLKQIETQIYEAAKNPANWGFAKGPFSTSAH